MSNQTTQFRSEIKLLLQAALLIFIFTVGIGILNGLDIMDFDRKQLMSHVHAGTLGWITLGFIAACLGIFSEGQTVTGWRAAAPRWLGIAAAIAIVFYSYAFYVGDLDWRLIGGSLTLAAIVGFYVWIIVQMRGSSKAGWAQVILPFVGGLVLTFGALSNNPMIIGMYIPFQVIGIIIYLIRLGPKMAAASWLANSSARHYAISAVFLVANVGLITYLIINFVSGAYGSPPDFTKIPSWLIFAMDHAMFIGVMTNGLFGLINDVAEERRSFWPWADHVLFWGMNIGIVGFVAGLAQKSAIIKQVFSPIMGIAILIAIVTYTLRLQTAPKSSSEDDSNKKEMTK
ncbi:MAG: hypothetical protein HZC38_13420 [Chloroflexi bacterium]|nr:hypothetical protein [Chloroflexota bacterium]